MFISVFESLLVYYEHWYSDLTKRFLFYNILLGIPIALSHLTCSDVRILSDKTVHRYKMHIMCTSNGRPVGGDNLKMIYYAKIR